LVDARLRPAHAASQRTGRELILNFHGLGEPHPWVDAQEKRYWWGMAGFTRLLDQISDRPPDADPRIAITFDDGNASDTLLALPELTKRGLTAEFFVCAGRIGKRHYLDKSMIRDLVDAGMQVGSHGMDHRDWRRLDRQGLETEIGDPRRKLEEVTLSPVTAVAIPFGSYDRRVLVRLKQEPLKCIYTSDRGIAGDRSKLKPRETLTDEMQCRDILGELFAAMPLRVRIKREFEQIYKRMR
jgi:peptidoglycan/xylan/chitin deacetylase (PgdA/CDA1 family)